MLQPLPTEVFLPAELPKNCGMHPAGMMTSSRAMAWTGAAPETQRLLCSPLEAGSPRTDTSQLHTQVFGEIIKK